MLHYSVYKNEHSNEWVTLIHGAGGSSIIWYKQIKTYRKDFNVLCIDLRGHGGSEKVGWKKGDTFVQVSEDVVEVLNHLEIEKSHFVGISLGTIVVQTITRYHSDRVQSMILGGAVIQLDIRTKFLIALGHLFKYILPYIWLYKLFAWIIMPKQAHNESRHAFVEQAKRMCQKQFIRWFTLTKSLNPYLRNLQLDSKGVPTLFVMGEEDHLFLTSIKELVKKQSELKLACIKDSGHVCNIDQPKRFNKITLNFMKYPNTA
ncbi:alpha/beta fold hydrolase [Haloplasma contractile]|uniref:Hydrolase alpha-beta fold family protein n=1 Tax=Haloplasma contractile SSD-17B TaxID=1033810 RepID=U2EDQ7_9MOLU|nr:alpha/beta hydrolase [Haloplasma contractile]ERJ13118.1 Hydrolase alpha-beta fold family protein [Haloplasma contractile SSD-17B]